MPSYIDGLIDSEMPRARDGIVIAMNEVEAEFSHAGAHGGSRMFVQYQVLLRERVTAYAELLRNRLAQFDPKHAPVADADFDKAMTSIDALAAFGVADYQRRQNMNASFGRGYGVPIDEDRLAAVVLGAQNEIRGLHAQFRSQRSISGRVRDALLSVFGQQAALALWTGAVFVLGFAAKALFDWLT